MLNIGLTGGIGAGKSTVSRTLSALGAVIVDGDVIAREVVEPGTSGLAALVERFGDSILSDDGSLDRPALASIAFADDESRAALNSIVHPLVGARREELIANAPVDAVIVQDIPLLVEMNSAPFFTMVVVVHLEEDERVRRLVEHRGIAEADARARIAAQTTDEARRAAADVWLDNSGTEEQLEAAVRRLWTDRIEPLAANFRSSTPARTRPQIVGPLPTWPADARRIATRLRAVCGDRAVRVDHIGSTAVRGMAAKDVIDVQVTVASIEVADGLREPLENVGFVRVPSVVYDNEKTAADVPGEADVTLWQKRFHASADPGRPVNVHLRVDGWPNQQFALLFPAWVAGDPGVFDEYLSVKREAARRATEHADDRAAEGAYVAAKEPWFDGAWTRAWEWARRTGWTA